MAARLSTGALHRGLGRRRPHLAGRAAARADLGPFPGLAVADLDSALTKQVRATLPSLEHRRADIFGPAAG